MDVKVNENCIACGLCISMCDDVFIMLDEGVAGAKDTVLPEFYDVVRDAAKSCPVDAIEVKE